MDISKKITQKSTQNKNKGRGGQVPLIIVAHRTSGSYNGAVNWLCNPGSQSSTHFVVAKDGRVAQLVSIEDTAWGNGTNVDSTDRRYYKNSTLELIRTKGGNANQYTISIEFEGLANENGELTDVQFNTGVELVKYIVSEVKRIYGTDIEIDAETLVGHCHITPKHKPNCPGKLFPFEKMIERVNGYMIEKRDYNINGEELKYDCIVLNGVTFGPIRAIAEKLGATVTYDGPNKKTTIKSKK